MANDEQKPNSQISFQVDKQAIDQYLGRFLFTGIALERNQEFDLNIDKDYDEVNRHLT